MTVRVALVDDQQLIHAGFRMVVDSQKDMNVVAEASDGATAIATLTELAEPTVKTHVGRVLAKLGARDRVQAVVIAYETGLVRAHGRGPPNDPRPRVVSHV